MNLQISLDYDDVANNNKNLEDIHYLITKMILDTEKEIFFPNYETSTIQKQILKDFVFNLHNIRREVKNSMEKSLK